MPHRPTPARPSRTAGRARHRPRPSRYAARRCSTRSSAVLARAGVPGQRWRVLLGCRARAAGRRRAALPRPRARHVPGAAGGRRRGPAREQATGATPSPSACAGAVRAARRDHGRLRDAEWIGVLCLLAGAALCICAVTGGRTLLGFVLAGRGLAAGGAARAALAGPYRSPAHRDRPRRRGAAHRACSRCSGWSSSALLFASADALFAEWVGRAGPRPGARTRSCCAAFVTVAVGGIVLAAAYLALNPPAVDPAGPARAGAHRFEWLAPVLVVDAVFAAFLVAQAAVIFGGHDYLERTTGLTYAEYVHQGFGQLTVATALTLLVIWAAARKAPRDDARRPCVAARLARPALRADAGRRRLGAAPDGRLPGGLRLHPAPPAGRRLRGLARAAGARGAGRPGSRCGPPGCPASP